MYMGGKQTQERTFQCKLVHTLPLFLKERTINE